MIRTTNTQLICHCANQYCIVSVFLKFCKDSPSGYFFEVELLCSKLLTCWRMNIHQHSLAFFHHLPRGGGGAGKYLLENISHLIFNYEDRFCPIYYAHKASSFIKTNYFHFSRAFVMRFHLFDAVTFL